MTNFQYINLIHFTYIRVHCIKLVIKHFEQIGFVKIESIYLVVINLNEIEFIINK